MASHARRCTRPLTWPTTGVPAALPATSIDTLPAGLFCRDLESHGYSYGEAVEYWALHGQPDQMDADLNGIPCETIYPAGDIDAYWYD